MSNFPLAKRRPAVKTPDPTPRAGSGQSLQTATATRLSSRFGHDFSHVRVHHDDTAALSASALGADAYTVGSEITFGKGQYAPGSAEGEALLAHELTHVVQQDRFGPGEPGTASGPGDDAEREADALAAQALAGDQVEVRATPRAGISRRPSLSPFTLDSDLDGRDPESGAEIGSSAGEAVGAGLLHELAHAGIDPDGPAEAGSEAADEAVTAGADAGAEVETGRPVTPPHQAKRHLSHNVGAWSGGHDAAPHVSAPRAQSHAGRSGRPPALEMPSLGTWGEAIGGFTSGTLDQNGPAAPEKTAADPYAPVHHGVAPPDQSISGPYGYANYDPIGDHKLPGYSAGFGVYHGRDPLIGDDTLFANGSLGAWQDGTSTRIGGKAQAGTLSLDLNKGGQVSGDIQGPNANAEASVGTDGATLGWGANLASGSVTARNEHETGRFGLSEGVGMTGRTHWDQGKDGYRSYGVGVDVGPISADFSTNDPLRTGIHYMTGGAAPLADMLLPDGNATDKAAGLFGLTTKNADLHTTADAARQMYHKAGGMASGVYRQGAKAYHEVERAASGAYHQGETLAKDVYAAGSSAVEYGEKKIGEAETGLFGTGKGALDWGLDRGKQALGGLYSTGQDTLHWGEDKAHEISGAVGGTLDSLKGWGEGKLGEAQSGVTGFLSEASGWQTPGQALDGTLGGLSRAETWAGGTLSDMAHGTEAKLEGAADWTKNTVGEGVSGARRNISSGLNWLGQTGDDAVEGIDHTLHRGADWVKGVGTDVYQGLDQFVNGEPTPVPAPSGGSPLIGRMIDAGSEYAREGYDYLDSKYHQVTGMLDGSTKRNAALMNKGIHRGEELLSDGMSEGKAYLNKALPGVAPALSHGYDAASSLYHTVADPITGALGRLMPHPAPAAKAASGGGLVDYAGKKLHQFGSMAETGYHKLTGFLGGALHPHAGRKAGAAGGAAASHHQAAPPSGGGLVDYAGHKLHQLGGMVNTGYHKLTHMLGIDGTGRGPGHAAGQAAHSSPHAPVHHHGAPHPAAHPQHGGLIDYAGHKLHQLGGMVNSGYHGAVRSVSHALSSGKSMVNSGLGYLHKGYDWLTGHE